MIDFSKMKLRYGILITDVFVCVSGDGKSLLDGHFAYSMDGIWLRVIEGEGTQDITDADSVVRALNAHQVKGSVAMHLTFERKH